MWCRKYGTVFLKFGSTRSAVSAHEALHEKEYRERTITANFMVRDWLYFKLLLLLENATNTTHNLLGCLCARLLEWSDMVAFLLQF